MMVRTVVSTFLVASILAVSSVAYADGPQVQPQPQQPVQYVAPLSQQTQPAYVPQSVALSGPKEIDAEEGMTIPPGYTAVERTRKGPIIGGAVTFGAMYLLTALGASIANDANHDNGASALFVPAVGPFIQMGKADGDTGKFFLVVDGLAQSAGLALLVYGLSSKKTVLMRNDLVVAPVIGQGTAGAGVLGRF